LKSAGQDLRLGLEIHFNPDRQASTSSGEGKEVSLFGFLSVLCDSSESHFLGDERVVKNDLVLRLSGRQHSVMRSMVLLTGTHFTDEPQ
jgi:hypothetical protein